MFFLNRMVRHQRSPNSDAPRMTWRVICFVPFFILKQVSGTKWNTNLLSALSTLRIKLTDYSLFVKIYLYICIEHPFFNCSALFHLLFHSVKNGTAQLNIIFPGLPSKESQYHHSIEWYRGRYFLFGRQKKLL